jgi:hypothetical protein
MSFLKPKAATSTQTSTSSSDNTNNGLITNAWNGPMQTGAEGVNFLGQMLGINPQVAGQVGHAADGVAAAGGAQQGYQNYLQQAGYAPAMAQLSKGVTGQGAASGLLRSGSTATALQTQGANLNNQFYTNYLQQLKDTAGLGLQAGGLITNAGQRSSSTSTGNSQGGGPSTLGSIASTVGAIAPLFSDRRLKTGIRKLRELADGLGIYAFRYRDNPQRFIGVMADEVARLRPWALGPVIGGYATVNYGAL